MFEKIQSIDNVSSFDLYHENLFYLTKDGHIPNLEEIDLSKITTNYTGEIFIINNYLVWQDGRGKSMIYDLEKSFLIFCNDNDDEKVTFKNIDLTSKEALMAVRRVKGKKHLSLYNLESRKFEQHDVKITHSICQGSLLFFINRENNKIQNIDINGEILWSYNITGNYSNIFNEIKNTELKNILGIYKETIWLSLTSGDLIGLNFETGKPLHTIHTNNSNFLGDLINEEDVKFLGRMAQLDYETGSIISLRNSMFFYVNLNKNNYRAEIFNLEENFNRYKIEAKFRSSHFPINNNKIFFCDDLKGEIGVFDIENKVIISVYDLGIKDEGIAKILDLKYENGLLYVLDRDNVLHVLRNEVSANI